MALRVLAAPGPTLFQDRGRPGMSAWGVGPSGAFDRRALWHANLLVGNEPDAAVLECLGGGLHLRATRDHALAVTGATGPIWVNGRPADDGTVLELSSGNEVRLGAPAVGLRWTVAVAGGFDPPPVLGSRSRDTLAALGPEPVQAGNLLSVGLATAVAWTGSIPATLPTGEVRIRVVLGPRDDWFTPDAIATFLSSPWLIDPDSDRVGLRLTGHRLERRIVDEMPSEPVIRGSIQVTNGGAPIILGPDHPVTGGYPVIGVVIDRDTDVLAQLRPGDVIRFERHSRTSLK